MHQEPAPSTAAVLGHPIHPMIVPFPIAFLCGALLTDIVYWQSGNTMWGDFSFWLIFGGIVSAGAAALFGFIDFLTIPRVREHKAGWLHMYLNVAAVVVAFVNLFMRWSDNPSDAIVPLGLIFSAATGVLLVFSGWFGGELSYKHKIGVMK